MTAPAHDSPVAVEFSREEAWVAHAALLDRIREASDADEEPTVECRALGELEADQPRFDSEELDALCEALVGYLGDAPLRDRAPGRAALQGVRSALPSE